MEVWQAVFRNLYTGFLLRDFAGKIVPGCFLLFSICTVFYEPKKLFQFLTKDLPTFTLIFLAGFSWIVTLGTQSLAEGLGIWRYFPDEAQATAAAGPKIGFWGNLFTRGDDSSFDKDTLQIDEFQSKATEDEEQQYERFVVIKEACGNLFVAGLLAVPAWLCGFVVRSELVRTKNRTPNPVWKYVPDARAVLGIFYALLIMVGLHRMHAQHVHRQYQFAKDLVEKHKGDPPQKPSVFHMDLEQKKP